MMLCGAGQYERRFALYAMLISARAEWLGRAFVAHDFKTTVHIGQGRSGGIGDGSHISDADIMASMGHNFIHGAFECSGATYNRPVGCVPTVDSAKTIGLVGVKAPRKAAGQGAGSFGQDIYAKYAVAPNGQTNPAVGSEADQYGGWVGGKRGKGADGCTCGPVVPLGGDDCDRLRNMAHRLNK